MTVPFMEALQRRDFDSASREIGAEVSPWLAEKLENFLRYRLGQLAVDPTIREWLGRAIVLTDQSGGQRVIGSIGFHGPPDADGKLEVGYSVDPGYRRRGYARESVLALFDWAHAEHGIGTFIASISPDNEPSLRLTEQLGFVRVGEQMDDVDGLEYVFEASWPPSD
jgi:RimJ/RimL family protein N-acetyltransferase